MFPVQVVSNVADSMPTDIGLGFKTETSGDPSQMFVHCKRMCMLIVDVQECVILCLHLEGIEFVV